MLSRHVSFMFIALSLYAYNRLIEPRRKLFHVPDYFFDHSLAVRFSNMFCCFSQESSFLKDALMLPWTLSTSQQPQQQMNRGFDVGIPEVRETVRPPPIVVSHKKCKQFHQK